MDFNIENRMLLPRIEKYYESIPDDVWADMESDDYDDMVFEQMNKEEEEE